MRKLLEFATLLGATALLLVACGSDEAEEAPVPAAQAAAPADDELPAMDDMAALKAPAAAPAQAPAAAPASSAIQPGASGNYVLQVSVWDNPASAKKHVRDLDALGVPAYVV